MKPTQKLLSSIDIQGVAEFIKSGKCRKIAFLTGAGMSVSAGIPDFRSPGGMYDTLRPELLTATVEQRKAMSIEPTTVVSWDLFRENQLPYLEVRRPFILGIAEQKWKATLAHYFARVCHDKGLLHTLFTQNIDGLDFQTEIPDEKIVSVHGSLGQIQCEFCKKYMPNEEFRELLRKNVKNIYDPDEGPTESTPIPCPNCSKPGVKPATVLYGTSLPPAFFNRVQDLSEVDVLIVIGTSLTVGPANQVPLMVEDECIRLIVNNEKVGQEMGIDYSEKSTRDVWEPLSADAALWKLSKALGWEDDLRAFKDRLPQGSQDVMDEK